MTRVSVEIATDKARANVAAMCTIERLATIFLASLVLEIATVPKRTETIASTVKISKDTTKLVVSINVIIPTVANFSEYPARTTLPGHVASTCASGNQNDKGKSGILPITTSDTAIAEAQTSVEDDENSDPALVYDEIASVNPA